MNHNTQISPFAPAFIGSTIENGIRQPLTAVTVVMINEQKGLRVAIQHLYKEGGVGRFYNGYQGFMISWVMRSLHRVTTFGVNQSMHEAHYSNISITFATTAAEFATTAFGELILTIAQNQEVKKKPLTLVRERYQREGVKVLTSGFLGNSARNIIFNGVLFSLKNEFVSEVKEYPLTMSGIISLAAVVFSHPPEVVRALKVKNPQKSYWQITKEIQQESNAKGFWIGLVPRIASVGAGTFIMMATFTFFSNR